MRLLPPNGRRSRGGYFVGSRGAGGRTLYAGGLTEGESRAEETLAE